MFHESLESRRLLSSPLGNLVGIFTDPTIQADRKALGDATHTSIVDQRAGRRTIFADQKAVRDEFKKLVDDKGQDAIDAALQPLKDQLRADEKAKNKEIRTAVQDLSTTKRTWAKTLLADLKVWRQARIDGDNAAADAAKTQLDKDKSAAQDALKPIRDNLMAIKDKWRPIITADHDAITGKLEDLDGDLKPLYAKLDSDTSALNDKLKTDGDAVRDATETLAADIKAYNDAHSANA
jgi:hypothetical protein